MDFCVEVVDWCGDCVGVGCCEVVYVGCVVVGVGLVG